MRLKKRYVSLGFVLRRSYEGDESMKERTRQFFIKNFPERYRHLKREEKGSKGYRELFDEMVFSMEQMKRIQRQRNYEREYVMRRRGYGKIDNEDRSLTAWVMRA